jgi:hypothetical protein
MFQQVPAASKRSENPKREDISSVSAWWRGGVVAWCCVELICVERGTSWNLIRHSIVHPFWCRERFAVTTHPSSIPSNIIQAVLNANTTSKKKRPRE